MAPFLFQVLAEQLLCPCIPRLAIVASIDQTAAKAHMDCACMLYWSSQHVYAEVKTETALPSVLECLIALEWTHDIGLNI